MVLHGALLVFLVCILGTLVQWQQEAIRTGKFGELANYAERMKVVQAELQEIQNMNDKISIRAYSSKPAMQAKLW